jgi:hypothetical protein
MSNNQPQTAGDCNDLTEKVARFLKAQDYWKLLSLKFLILQ